MDSLLNVQSYWLYLTGGRPVLLAPSAAANTRLLLNVNGDWERCNSGHQPGEGLWPAQGYARLPSDIEAVNGDAEESIGIQY
jgi:hypothetical protein